MPTPTPPIEGLRHLALYVSDVERSVAFYQEVFGMELEWQPDPDNAYLTGGTDNLAIHRGQVAPKTNLDHLGFLVPTMDAVDAWEVHIRALGHEPFAPAKTHRDGARSFYFPDPDGHVIQILFHPPISRGTS
ncbi:MAG: glyoxalase [Planctomycetes bacterium]|nr:glyoxalase [Planctomycetota bacterium]